MVFILLTIVLTMGLVGVNIGAPYKAIGFIKELNNVAAALNLIFDRMCVCMCVRHYLGLCRGRRLVGRLCNLLNTQLIKCIV